MVVHYELIHKQFYEQKYILSFIARSSLIFFCNFSENGTCYVSTIYVFMLGKPSDLYSFSEQPLKYYQSPNDHYIRYQHNECVAFWLYGV